MATGRQSRPQLPPGLLKRAVASIVELLPLDIGPEGLKGSCFPAARLIDLMLRPNVIAAKARLAKGYEDFKARHKAGATGTELCALNSNLRDAVIMELVEAALDDLGMAGNKGLLNEIAIVAHGGYGRRDDGPVQRRRSHDLAPARVGLALFPMAERLVMCSMPGSNWAIACGRLGKPRAWLAATP